MGDAPVMPVMRCTVKACPWPVIHSSGLCAIHLRDGVAPFAYNPATMPDTSLNASDSIQASIRSAEQKAAHHAAQIRVHMAEEAKWRRVAENLGDALRISTMPASDVVAPPARATNQMVPAKRTRVDWLAKIEPILMDPSCERPTRKELVRLLLEKNPGALEVTVYQAVQKFVKARAIRVHFDKCYLPKQMDVEGRPLAQA